MNPSQFATQAKNLTGIGILFLIFSGVMAQEKPKVFVTKTGAKYHKSSYRYAETGRVATLTEAKEKGLTACLVCKLGGGSATTPANSSYTETNSLRSTPSTSKPAATISSSHCKATTKAGSRCSRKASA